MIEFLYPQKTANPRYGWSTYLFENLMTHIHWLCWLNTSLVKLSYHNGGSWLRHFNRQLFGWSFPCFPFFNHNFRAFNQLLRIYLNIWIYHNSSFLLVKSASFTMFAAKIRNFHQLVKSTFFSRKHGGHRGPMPRGASPCGPCGAWRRAPTKGESRGRRRWPSPWNRQWGWIINGILRGYLVSMSRWLLIHWWIMLDGGFMMHNKYGFVWISILVVWISVNRISGMNTIHKWDQ